MHGVPGTMLAKPGLSIAQYAQVDASSGTFGGPLKDPDAQADRVKQLTSLMNGPKQYILYWLKHLPASASPETRARAEALAKEIAKK